MTKQAVPKFIGQLYDVTLGSKLDNSILTIDSNIIVDKTLSDVDIATGSYVDAHKNNTSNPHTVTLAQVGGIDATGVTYENLNTNGDVGTASGTVAAGNDSRFLSSTQKTDLTDSGDSTLHYHASDRSRANHTGTQTASTISDFDLAVGSNSAVTANTAKISYTDQLAVGSNTTHRGLTNNPHSVTAAQVGAVDLTGSESIGGTKTFTSFPITPSSAPSADYEVANKKYVDDEIIGAGGYNDEAAQDAIGSIITNTATITFTYDDDVPFITADVVTGSVDHDGLLNTHNLTTDIDHDQLTNFSSDEHFTQAAISITASQVSDFNLAVGSDAAVLANTAKISYTDQLAVGSNTSHREDSTIHLSSSQKTDLTDGNDSTAHYHAADRARDVHTGSQAANTIYDFDLAVGSNSAVVANTAKVTNAEHTGEVTGSTALTVDKTAITGKSAVTAVGTDYVIISDTSDSGNLKKALISDFASAGGDMAAATYDPTNVAGDAFDMDNMVEGSTNLILTSSERTAISDNSAKVTNATHDGDATGSGTLTLSSTAITGKSEVTANGSDYVIISDTSDSGNLKKALVSDFISAGAGDVSKVGTPADNQVGVWTGDGTIEGDADLTWDGSTLTAVGAFKVQDATPTKAYRFRTNGSALDFEAGGAPWVISNWSGADFTGTQYYYMYLNNSSHQIDCHGKWNFRDTNVYNNSGSSMLLVDVDNNEIVINEDGGTYNFRVEGDTETGLLKVDATNDRVGIKTLLPNYDLDVTGTINATGSILLNGDLVVDRSIHTGTQTADTISDFNLAVGSDAVVTANTGFRTDPSSVITAGSNLEWDGTTLNATAGTGMTELMDDTSPRLGGNLDLANFEIVSDNADTAYIFARAKIGYNGADSDEAAFGHRDALTSRYYGLKCNSTGATTDINAGTTLYFRIYDNATASLTSSGFQLGAGVRINEFSSDDTMAGDSDTAVPTEQAVKAYVDNNAGIANVVDDTTPQLGSDLDWNGFGLKLVGQTAGGSDGNIIYLTSSGWSQADADAEATCSGMLGIQISSTDVLTQGIYTTSGLATGSIYYVDTTAGGMTITPPSGTGDIVRIIGYAISSTQLYFDPDKTYIEVA